MASHSSSISLKSPKFTELNNLASADNGTRILFATDDWFAAAENLLEVGEPVWKEGVFDNCGKWMDGWETRRKRIPGHDWAIIKLGYSGIIHGVDVDTAFFTGNYTPKISIQAANISSKEESLIPSRRKGKTNGHGATSEELATMEKLQSHKWVTIVPKTQLGPGYESTRHTFIPVINLKSWTHLRLNMFPDGGIARLRVYGQVARSFETLLKNPDGLVDLIGMENGGICTGYSDAHYGHPRNIILPGMPANMSEGWETARRLDRPEILVGDSNGVLQVPGYEDATFRLGFSGIVSKIQVETWHFKGNFPDSIQIHSAQVEDEEDESNAQWETLLAPQKLGAHQKHIFEGPFILTSKKITNVRVRIAPDGGIARLRLWGHPTR